MNDHIHGARWWKFDFHTHSPISNDYGKGDATQRAITPEQWLLMHMSVGMDCVAITDHNSGEWVDKLKAALALLDETQPEGYKKLVLFPGVEISASGNIHILALFDPSAGTKEIQALLGAIKFPTESTGTSDAVSPLAWRWSLMKSTTQKRLPFRPMLIRLADYLCKPETLLNSH